MRQDVDEFERLLDTAPRHGLDQETLAGLLCGRRRDGTHLGPTARPGDEPDFAGDPSGAGVPHRLPHPARQPPVGARRDPGPPRPPAHPARQAVHRASTARAEKGLLGYFLCASLAAQYEAMLNDWMHGGVHHPPSPGPTIPSSGSSRPAAACSASATRTTASVDVDPVPQLVVTKGVMYLFLPGRRALERLASERRDRARRRAADGPRRVRHRDEGRAGERPRVLVRGARARRAVPAPLDRRHLGGRGRRRARHRRRAPRARSAGRPGPDRVRPAAADGGSPPAGRPKDFARLFEPDASCPECSSAGRCSPVATVASLIGRAASSAGMIVVPGVAVVTGRPGCGHSPCRRGARLAACVAVAAGYARCCTAVCRGWGTG